VHLRFRTSDVVLAILLAVSLGATSYLAYWIVGFLGVGVLGMIIGVVALTVELERGGPVGHGQASGLYSQHMAAETKSPAEKAARRAEIESAAFPLLVAKIVSAALIVVGLGLFFVFQLGA
jgi:hypothetical protein